MFLFSLLRYISLIADLAILLVIYYLYQAIKGLFTGSRYSFGEWIDEIGNELYSFAGKWSQIVLIVSLISLLLTNTAVHQLVGINNLELKPEGTYCFYVEATSPNGKTYTLPAQIRVEKHEEEYDERTRTYKYYFIEKVFFSNGGYLDADDGFPDYIDESSSYHDDDYNYWELILLNEHAYSPQVKETNNANWFDMTFLSIEVISASIILYALLKQTNKTTDE